MATKTGESGAGPPLPLRLLHGHPVVASFFHTIRVRASQGAGRSTENGREGGEAEGNEDEEGGGGKAEKAVSGGGATSGDADGGVTSPPAAHVVETETRATKKRRRSRTQKPSYVARREEKEALEREVRELAACARELRDAAGISDVIDALEVCAALREAAGRAREQLAAARSVLSQHARQTDASPLHSFLRLPRDWAARRALMLSLRTQKLQEARQFLAARTRHLSEGGAPAGRSLAEQSTWTTAGGDVCGVRLEVTPFRGVGSAQRVADALLFYFIHLEISLSEQTGNTAVREDDEGSAAEPGVLHHRLQIAMPGGAVVEKSSVLFVDRPAPVAVGARGELLFVAGDFVDEDERFPYLPRERVRKDISTLIQLSAVPASKGDEEPGGSKSGGTVVMTKWQFLKLHAARELEGDGRRPLRTEELERLHADHMRGLDSVVATMRQFLYGAEYM